MRGKIAKKPHRKITLAAIDRILEMHANGRTFTKACEEENLPKVSVWDWLQKHAPERYARARKLSVRAMVDAINDKIAECQDPVQANLLRVQMDVIKWTASKVDPKTFGDKIQSELSGPDGSALPPAMIAVTFVAPTQTALPPGDEDLDLPALK